MLLVLAVLSLAIGNITAIAQTNIKRMLAYSTIAQMGFVLLGLLSGVAGTTDRTGIGCLQRRHVLRDHLRADHRRHLRHADAAVARRLRSRQHQRLQGPEQAQRLVRCGDDHPDVLAGRRAADDGLCAKFRAELGAGHRPDLADRVGRDVLADRRVLLPARGQAHVVR
jgi:hypothetical protein